MMLLLLLMLQQSPGPATVGDTLWASRSLTLSPGDRVRPAAWELDGVVQLLGRPVTLVSGNRALVRYPLVAWEAGSHVLDVPGPIVTRASGAEDTLGSHTVTFIVRSVLPSGVPDSQLAVQPPAFPVLRGFRSLLPALVLTAAGALLLVPLHWWWRRRGRPAAVARAAGDPEGPPEDMVRRWADAGERRTVAGIAALRLREAIAESLPAAHPALDTGAVLALVERERPDWPRDDLREALESLDGLRFAPSRAGSAFDLYQRSLQLAAQVRGGRR